MFTVEVPKAPLPVITYVLGWSPDHDARQWMKGQTPLWACNVPIDVLASKYLLPLNSKQGMAARIIGDSIKRFGYADTPPAYLEQDSTKFDWPFTWPENPNQWRLAPQETTLAHVYWAFKQGYVEAFHVAALQFLAYYNHGWVPGTKPELPTQWSELRNAGNAALNYGTNGRHRMVRGCIDYPTYILKMLKDLGITSGSAVGFLQGLLTFHVLNLDSKFPLIDIGAGDHLGDKVPFVSTYQTASLEHTLAVALLVTSDGATLDAIHRLLTKIHDLLVTWGPADRVNNPSWWWYDIPFVNGMPVAGDPTNPRQAINKGVAGVASYIVPVLDGLAGAEDLWAAMRDDAMAKKFPALQPAETAWMFGTVDL